MKSPVARTLLRLGLAVYSMLFLSACASPAYHFQVASGHLGLLHARQDIDDYIASAPEGDSTSARLLRAQEILEFAAGHLALPAGDSYQSFVAVDDSALVWNVVATPLYSLEAKKWCFIVAGCVPYRGYFDRSDAQEFAGKLQRKGLDTTVSGAAAYSTLGWFDDPIPGPMLKRDDAQLAGLLFHELAHQQLYVRGASGFNEAYASVVEEYGVKAWLEAQEESDLAQRIERREQAASRFHRLLLETRAELQSLYASDKIAEQMESEKRATFVALEQRYLDVVREEWDGQNWFGGWFDPPPNNADLALMGTYKDGTCALESLFVRSDGDFAQFHELARQASKRKDLDVWLAQSCESPVIRQ